MNTCIINLMYVKNYILYKLEWSGTVQELEFYHFDVLIRFFFSLKC